MRASSGAIVLGRWLTLGALAASATIARADAPGPEEALRAFTALDGWVRAWSIPATVENAIAPSSRGAAVTLRLGGHVVGRGVSAEDGDAGLLRAAAAAVDEASGAVEVERDLLADDRRRARLQRVMIELELAGDRAPVIGGTFASAAQRVSPGVEGVGVRVGQREELVFPGAQLAAGFDPARSLRAAAGSLGLRPVELQELRAEAGAVALRFPTVHLAQPAAGAGPVFLTRGGGVLPAAAVTGATLRTWAAAIAQQVSANRWMGADPDAGYGLRGDYLATIGRYEPLVAGPREQAVAAWALLRFARSAWVGERRAEEARSLAVGVLRDLTRIAPGEQDPLATPAPAAAWALAAAAARGATGELIDRAFWDGALDAVERAAADGAVWLRLPDAERAFIAFAIGRAARADRELGNTERADRLGALAEQTIQEVLTSARLEGIVGLMPWAGWAELDRAGEGEIASKAALRAARSLCWDNQLRGAPGEIDEPDLLGGIVFSRGGGARPTAQSLRPLAFMATMLGDPRLTLAEELPQEIASHRRGLRFVGQLLVRERELALVADARRAGFGVRRSGWDWALTLDGASLALVTFCETLDSLAARAEGDKGEPGEPPAD